eukprot:TRINITY_DN275_c0_g1_i1.p1 TRINITY_DN275_c0_g1~~TRINITY_DN275_c0_g1_i1.p1  ORF type:complete len:266 (+),score=37.05 TRINITY_DN275_c0_g1_i1:78-875(+)
MRLREKNEQVLHELMNESRPYLQRFTRAGGFLEIAAINFATQMRSTSKGVVRDHMVLFICLALLIVGCIVFWCKYKLNCIGGQPTIAPGSRRGGDSQTIKDFSSIRTPATKRGTMEIRPQPSLFRSSIRQIPSSSVAPPLVAESTPMVKPHSGDVSHPDGEASNAPAAKRSTDELRPASNAPPQAAEGTLLATPPTDDVPSHLDGEASKLDEPTPGEQDPAVHSDDTLQRDRSSQAQNQVGDTVQSTDAADPSSTKDDPGLSETF